MLGPIWNSTSLPLLEKLAAFGERRHEVLAGNVANIDTPGYRMRDLPVADFQKALSQAVAQFEKTGLAAPPSASQHSVRSPEERLDDLFPPELFRPREADPSNLTFHDKNNRSIEYQIMELTKNLLTQQFALRVLRAQFDQLQAVIAERP